jgi:hypothetical protein
LAFIFLSAVRGVYAAKVVLTLILRQGGAEIKRFANVAKPDELRSAIAAAVAKPRAIADLTVGIATRYRRRHAIPR